jgi:EAL domain-containing protein (putative c-di-GMP-specific phosphodiesterase class I)
VDIAKGLGKRTIAEFVGDQATLDLLKTYGVDYAQGFFIARPGPINGSDMASGPEPGVKGAVDERVR